MNVVRSFAAVFSLLSVCLSSGAFAEGVTSKEYGQLYIVEQREQEVKPWRFGLNTSYEFGNPYSSVYGVHQTFEHSLGRFVWVGVQVSEYLTGTTQLMTALREDLRGRHIRIHTETPRFAASAIGTVVPLSGHLNVFGNHSLEAELGVRLGLGAISYKGQDARFLISWSIRPIAYLSRQWSLQAGFGQDIESLLSEDRVARFKGDLGIGFHF